MSRAFPAILLFQTPVTEEDLLMDVVIISVTPFALTMLVPAVGARWRKTWLAWLLGSVLALLWIVLLSHLTPLTTSGPDEIAVEWVPRIGLNLSLYLDGLSLVFALLITGIGAMVVIYAGYYFDDLNRLKRFYRLLFAFMGGMLGLVLAGNLLTLFICWEITGITSFFLISFDGSNPAARRGALQALIVTAGGGLALLTGLVLLGEAAGSTEISHILAGNVREHPLFAAAAVLILIGCFSKSAQWPLHFWLPEAMTAPTPASAFLHSATMVKAGIYLLLRLYPTLGDTALWQATLTTTGLVTMLVGAVIAVRQRDLKGALAYSTISQLGALVALIGQPHGVGLQAALIGVIAHALYKATLFLVAGIVEHSTGTRDLNRLGGLARKMPGTAVIGALAGLSMAGLPPLLGFVAKEGLIESLLQGPLPALTMCIVVFSAALTVAMALILVWDVFFRSIEHEHPSACHHAPLPGMLMGPGLLAAGSLAAGLNLNALILPVLVTTGYAHSESPRLLSGFNAPLVLSAIAITGGLATFMARDRWLRWQAPTLPRGRDLYDSVIGMVEAAANIVLRSQGGKTRYYLITILISVIVLMTTAGLSPIGSHPITVELSSSADVLKIVLLLLSLGATFASIVLKRHLIAALALGMAGYSVGGIFMLEPAPDVALVQFLVETLGTVLVITMLGKISHRERQHVIANLWNQSRRGIVRDAVIATLVGVGVGLFTLSAVVNRPERQTITSWHINHALSDVGATDIVAAIVTDFRGMDTIIEITVFGMAALGVLTLLSAGHNDKHPPIKKEVATLHARTISRIATPLTRRVAILLAPFAFLIALAHILYSGVAPGDGFTAGVVSGLAVALWYVVLGYDEAKRRLRWLRPAPLIGSGVLLAVLNAGLPLLFGKPFLATTLLEQIHLPAGIHLTSTMVFETGIFLSVLGGTSIILETIAHPQEIDTL